MERLVSSLILLAAIIHLLPITGFFGPARLQALYGVAVTEPNLVVLMRHRALLFGILGALLVAAAFHRDWQVPALAAGLVSVIGFQGLAVPAEGLNAALRKVVLVDWVALAALLAAAGLRLWLAVRPV